MKKTITHKPKAKRYKVKSWKQKHKVGKKNYKSTHMIDWEYWKIIDEDTGRVVDYVEGSNPKILLENYKKQQPGRNVRIERDMDRDKTEQKSLFFPGKKIKELSAKELRMEMWDEDKEDQSAREESAREYDTYADLRYSVGKKKARQTFKEWGWPDSTIDYLEEEYDKEET
jgi:hypothetical protein